MSLVALILAISVAFWVGFAFRGILAVLLRIAELLESQKPEPDVPKKSEARFAEPKTAIEIAVDEERDRIRKLNHNIEL